MSIKARYDVFARDREPFLQRARVASQMVMPGLYPLTDAGDTSGSLPETFTTYVTGLVVGLAGKMTTALVPPEGQMVTLKFDQALLMQAGLSEAAPEDQQMLSELELAIQQKVTGLNWRDVTTQQMIEVIVGGTTGELMLQDGDLAPYRLDNFVLIRDNKGNVSEWITRERIDAHGSPPEVRAMVDPKRLDPTNVTTYRLHPPYLYTWGRRRDDGKWPVNQAVDETAFGPDHIYPISPFNALGWNWRTGENYARSKVEQHSGDIRSLEGLSKAVVDGAGLAAKHIVTIRPNAGGIGGRNLVRRLTAARNGDIIVANPEDINAFSFVNGAGIQFTAQSRETVARELAKSFLATSASVRDAERVTKAEVALLAEEIDEVLGGTYTSMSRVQGSRVRFLMAIMQARGELVPWPDGTIQPTVLTGLRALEQQRLVNNIATFLQLTQGIPQEILAAYPEWEGLLRLLAVGLNLPKAVKSTPQVAAEQEAAQENALDMQAASQATEQAIQGQS